MVAKATSSPDKSFYQSFWFMTADIATLLKNTNSFFVTGSGVFCSKPIAFSIFAYDCMNITYNFRKTIVSWN